MEMEMEMEMDAIRLRSLSDPFAIALRSLCDQLPTDDFGIRSTVADVPQASDFCVRRS